MLFVAMWHLVVYCPLAHWVFNPEGWIFKYGAIDFAGGLVVHVSSGVSAFVAAFWVGKSPIEDDKKPHNIPYVLLGASLLWFGWFGFNAGSALGANWLAGLAFANTQLGASSAMLTWNVLEVTFSSRGIGKGRPTAVGAAIGCVVGLVAITPGCAFVEPMWAIFIGFFTALFVFFTLKVIKKIPVDDTLDVFAVHGVGGAVGSLLTGLFSSSSVNPGAPDGGFYGNGNLFGYQIVALLATIALCVVATSLIMLLLKLLAKLIGSDIRISAEDAVVGIDDLDHGELAYNYSHGLLGEKSSKDSHEMKDVSTNKA